MTLPPIHRRHFLSLGAATLASCGGSSASPFGPASSLAPDQKQKMLITLAMLANVNYGITATTEAELVANTAKIEKTLTSGPIQGFFQSPWQVVWGPVITNSRRPSASGQAPYFVTDNTLYVAKGRDPTTGQTMYAVGIAGTNIVSSQDWLAEDFNVLKTVDWLPIDTSLTVGASYGKISLGTHTGLNRLLALRDPRLGQNVLEFLLSLDLGQAFDIAVTGHSLGGALTPALALKILETLSAQGCTHLTVSAYPAAGPTPGDSQFAAYATQRLGKNYRSIINRYDIVPASWQVDTLLNLPGLYASASFSGLVQAMPIEKKLALDFAIAATRSIGYTRIATDREYVFNGPPSAAVVNVLPPVPYFNEASFQHTKAYLMNGLNLPADVIAAIFDMNSI